MPKCLSALFGIQYVMLFSEITELPPYPQQKVKGRSKIESLPLAAHRVEKTPDGGGFYAKEDAALMTAEEIARYNESLLCVPGEAARLWGRRGCAVVMR